VQLAGAQVARLAWSSLAVHVVRCALSQTLVRSMPVVPALPESQLRFKYSWPAPVDATNS